MTDIAMLRSAIDAAPSPLAAYALTGLHRCWMPERGLFSHRYTLEGATPGNESQPASDPFYSLNVLLGLGRLPNGGRDSGFDLAAIFDTAARALTREHVPLYAFGMGLWAAAELEFPLPPETLQRCRALLTNDADWHRLTAQDLGMLLSGCVAQARRSPSPWSEDAHRLSRLVFSAFDCGDSALFYNNARGFRRRFASFATCTYLTLALYHYGEWSGDQRAIARANAATAALIARQGPRGEWPWFYHAPSGRVVDMYEVYAVHQDGMAPAFLHHAVSHGVAGAREALVKGFRWILGDNQLGLSMLAPDLGLIYRSQKRKTGGRGRRAVRAIAGSVGSSDSGLIADSQVDIRRECRSYHLGWVLWSFAGREDYRELTHHAAFGAGGRA